MVRTSDVDEMIILRIGSMVEAAQVACFSQGNTLTALHTYYASHFKVTLKGHNFTAFTGEVRVPSKCWTRAIWTVVVKSSIGRRKRWDSKKCRITRMCIFGWFDANGDVGDAHFCKETSQRTPKKRNTYVLDAANALNGQGTRAIACAYLLGNVCLRTLAWRTNACQDKCLQSICLIPICLY